MGDTERGSYPSSYPFWKALGKAGFAAQGNIAVRSNLEWFGPDALTDTGTLVAGTGIQVSVPVPVEVGDEIATVAVVVGGTACSTPTHQFAALYAGHGTAPALLGQSTAITTAAIAASAVYGWTLTSKYIVAPADCPNGYVYASFCIVATALPSLATVSTATAVSYQWFQNMPIVGVNGVSHGSSLSTTAAATIASASALATTPAVFLY